MKVTMSNFKVQRDIALVFYSLVTVVSQLPVLGRSFLGTGIKTYFKLYWKREAEALIVNL